MHPDMAKRYFDPVAALGTEAPRLDLGIRFAKSESGETVKKYSAPALEISKYDCGCAAAASGSNTFVKDDDMLKPKKKRGLFARRRDYSRGYQEVPGKCRRF